MYARKTKSIKRKRKGGNRRRRNMTEVEESRRGVSELSITAGIRMARSRATCRVKCGMEMRMGMGGADGNETCWIGTD